MHPLFVGCVLGRGEEASDVGLCAALKPSPVRRAMQYTHFQAQFLIFTGTIAGSLMRNAGKSNTSAISDLKKDLCAQKPVCFFPTLTADLIKDTALP